MLSIRCCSRIRSKIIPDNSNTKLVPDRVYKENRANWKSNYTIENQKQTNANWSLPAWDEPQPNNWNNQSQNNLKSARKVSAKQHYLSVARYVAGQSTNLPSRYQHFRTFLKRILATNLALILGYLIACCFLGQENLHRQIFHQTDNWLITLNLKKSTNTEQIVENIISSLISVFQIIYKIPYFGKFLLILKESLAFIIYIVFYILRCTTTLIKELNLSCLHFADSFVFNLSRFEITLSELLKIIWELLIFLSFLIILVIHTLFSLILHYFFLIINNIYWLITDPNVKFSMIKILVKFPCKSSWGRFLGISRFCDKFLGRFVQNSWGEIFEGWLQVIEYSKLMNLMMKWSPVIVDLLYRILWKGEKLTIAYVVFSITLYGGFMWFLYLCKIDLLPMRSGFYL